MEGELAPRRNHRVVFRELVDGHGVLLHLDTGAYHGLNPTGAIIWSLTDGDRTITDIAREVQERVDEDLEDLTPVVVEFVDQLRERDLVS